MPHYFGNIPDLWEDALERKTGARLAVKAVLDPDGLAIALDGDTDIIGVSEIVSGKELDLSSDDSAYVQDVTAEFNDMDNEFDADDQASLFHRCEGTLFEDAAAAVTAIKLIAWDGVAFAEGEILEISDDANSERVTVSGFTADDGSTGYHQLTIASPGLTHDYSAGSRIYTIDAAGKKLLLKLSNQTEDTVAEIPIFEGTIIKVPETEAGKASIVMADSRKTQLDSALTGADASDELKLMCIGPDGTLRKSMVWENDFHQLPLTFEIVDGALPDGITINSESGALSGKATETGTFTFTIRVTNAAGDSKEQECTLLVYDRWNTEMDSAGGMADFTFADYYDPSREYHNLTAGGEGYLRLGWIAASVSTNFEETWCSGSNRGWYKLSHEYTPPCVEITSPGSLTGAWTLIARIKGDNLGSSSAHIAGIYVRKIDEADEGYYGLACGFRGGKTAVAAVNIDDENTIGSASGVASDLIFRISKSGTTYSFAYRTPSGSWISLGSKVATWTPGFVGVCAVRTSIAGERTTASIDIDYLRLHIGVLAVATTSLPHAKAGCYYDFTLRATGGAGEYVWDISSGSLPSGLSLDSATGKITGYLAANGTTSFTVRVTDGAGSTATAAVSIVGDSASELLPDIYSDAGKNLDYNEQTYLFIGGMLDRDQIVIGSRCPVGKWEFQWSSAFAFTVTPPSLTPYEGEIRENFEIPDIITIPAAAWTAGMAEGDTMSFVTGITWDDENPVKIIYDIMTARVGTPAKLVDASSFFGEIEAGELYEAVASGAATFKIATSVNLMIPAGSTLTLEDGVNSQDVTVDEIDYKDSFPPYITVNLSSGTHGYDFAAGTLVTIKQAQSLDAARSYDAEYEYCKAADIRLRITLDRAMTVAQAVEAICSHAGLVQYHWFGLECLHCMRPRLQLAVHEFTNADIKPEVESESTEIVNVITVYYGYDGVTQEYLKSHTYPESQSDNPSYRRYGKEVSVEIYAPGLHDDTQAESMARRLYELYSNGIRSVTINCDFQALLMRIGEQWDLDINDPDIAGRFETIRKSILAMTPRNVSLTGYDAQVYDKFAMPDSAMADMHCAW